MTLPTVRTPSPWHGTRLARLGFLSHDDTAALNAIAGQVRHHRRGAEIFAEGTSSDHVHVVFEGWACRFKTTRAGARQITGFILPGDICNLDSLSPWHSGVGVRTMTTACVIRLRCTDLERLATERPSVATALMRCMSLDHAILTEWAMSLGRHSARKRVARLLCEMAQRLGGTSGNSASFDWPMTQEQIGDALGLTAVHVNRTIGQLRADRLIVVAGRKVTIPNLSELRGEAEFDGAYLEAARVRRAMNGEFATQRSMFSRPDDGHRGGSSDAGTSVGSGYHTNHVGGGE